MKHDRDTILVTGALFAPMQGGPIRTDAADEPVRRSPARSAASTTLSAEGHDPGPELSPDAVAAFGFESAEAYRAERDAFRAQAHRYDGADTADVPDAETLHGMGFGSVADYVAARDALRASQAKARGIR